MDERAFYSESQTTKPLVLNCPYCRSAETYDLKWMVRKKKDRLPGGADERDRAKFAKAQSYMVLIDNKVACRNIALPQAVRHFRHQDHGVSLDRETLALRRPPRFSGGHRAYTTSGGFPWRRRIPMGCAAADRGV